jgi:hypothetical protein
MEKNITAIIVDGDIWRLIVEIRHQLELCNIMGFIKKRDNVKNL